MHKISYRDLPDPRTKRNSLKIMHLQKNFEMLVRISVVFQGMQKISNANLNLAKMYKNSAQYFLKSNNCFMFRSPEI